MVQIQIQQKSIKYYVYDADGVLRGFYLKQEALNFMGNDKSLTLKYKPSNYKSLFFEEAPF
jgi:hypothetical protein